MGIFEKNEIYWFKLKTDKAGIVNIKGKVVEENDFLVKIERDDGSFEIITLSRILNVNKEKIKKVV